MPEIIDLATLLGDEPSKQPDELVDTSGKPVPENVRVILVNKLEIKCELRYDGLHDDGKRRYLVLAEIDWETHFPTHMIIGVMPTNTWLAFHMPDDVDIGSEENRQRANDLRKNIVIERWVHC